MGCDMVVALGSATATGSTVFASNYHGPLRQRLTVRREVGKAHSPGETVSLPAISLPQARQTYTVLAWQEPQTWGYHHGVNEHHVAAGCAAWQSLLGQAHAPLTGPDLVRLALERSRTARQALELVTDLVTRHGQTGSGPRDNVFLLADGQEAYVLEAAGPYWAWIECREVRAVSDVGLVRQDWQRLSPGLAEHAIAQGWWPDDGTKLDFSSLCQEPLGQASALRRWGRASFLLEQQNGHIDLAFVRRLLSDHYEGTHFEVDPSKPGAGPKPLCRHATPDDALGTTASFLTSLSADSQVVPMVWCTFGPPCLSVFLPIFLDGQLPEGYRREGTWNPYRLTDLLAEQAQRWGSWRKALAQLQARLDQETEDFLTEATALKKRDDHDTLHRQTTLFMQNHLEQLEAAYHRLYLPAPRRPVYSPVAR